MTSYYCMPVSTGLYIIQAWSPIEGPRVLSRPLDKKTAEAIINVLYRMQEGNYDI